MSRSQAVREEALRLDGERCQICGADKRTGAVLEVHHVDPLGIGGSDERDTVENVITLCGTCHVWVTGGVFVIAKWDRGHVVDASFTKDGEDVDSVFDSDGFRGTSTIPILEVIDNQNQTGHGIGKIPHEHLWFYRRKDAEEGEQILSELARFTLLDKTIAERVHRLGQVVKSADPDARSLRECLASRGLLASQLLAAARLYAKSLETHVTWPDGMSVSDYRGLLNDSGHGSAREYFYVMIPARSWLTGARPEVYYRTAHEQALRDTMEMGARLYKIGKTVWGLRAEGGDLIDPEGRKVDVIHFVPKDA